MLQLLWTSITGVSKVYRNEVFFLELFSRINKEVYIFNIEQN